MNAEREVAVLIKRDKNKQLTVEARGLTLPGGIQLCLAAIEAMCKETLSRADDPKLVKSLEEDMYEMINIGASSLLNRLFPDIEMRPDITVDALIEAENKLVKEKGKEYMDAYGTTAQADKDLYESSLARANIALQNINREQRRKAKIKKK